MKFISSCSPKTVLRIGLLYTNKNGGDFGANSVTKRNCAAPISKVENHISDRCIHNIYIYTGLLLVLARKAIRCSVIIDHLRLIRIYSHNRNPLESTENHLISNCGEVIKVLEN